MSSHSPIPKARFSSHEPVLHTAPHSFQAVKSRLIHNDRFLSVHLLKLAENGRQRSGYFRLTDQAFQEIERLLKSPNSIANYIIAYRHDWAWADWVALTESVRQFGGLLVALEPNERPEEYARELNRQLNELDMPVMEDREIPPPSVALRSENKIADAHARPATKHLPKPATAVPSHSSAASGAARFRT